MKTTLLFLCLSAASCFGQEVYLGNAILYSITAGYTEGLQLKERYDTGSPSEQRKLNSLWHSTQLAERAMGISLGITIADYSKLEWKKLLLSVFLSAAIYWNLYDGTINMVRHDSFYHMSDTSTAFTEKYGNFKIPVLAIALGINYLMGAFSD